jgi:transposase
LPPQDFGCGSAVICWSRLPGALWTWQAAGVWERLHTRLLNWLGDEAAIDGMPHLACALTCVRFLARTCP